MPSRYSNSRPFTVPIHAPCAISYFVSAGIKLIYPVLISGAVHISTVIRVPVHYSSMPIHVI